MAHNISIQNGIAEVFTAKTPAWHGLGITVTEAPTWQDASRLAHLDWTISKVQFQNPRLSGVGVPSYALLRDDNNSWLSTVGEGYTPVQNSDCFAFCDSLIATGKVVYESAGALGNGEKVWVLAKLPHTFEPVKGDAHETYLLCTDDRSGRALRLCLTTTRVVCQNTLNQALSGAKDSIFSIRHTASVQTRINEAKQLIATTGDIVEALKLKMNALARTKVTRPKFDSVMEKLFPGFSDDKNARMQNKAGIVASNFMNAEYENEKGSAFALLQAVTHYIDHQRDGLRVGSSSLDMKRKESALFGTGNDFKNLAFATVCAEFDVGETSDIDALLHSVESI